MKRLPKEEHANRLALYNKGFTDRQIADELQCTISAINNWRRRYDLPSNKPQKETIKKRSPLAADAAAANAARLTYG